MTEYLVYCPEADSEEDARIYKEPYPEWAAREHAKHLIENGLNPLECTEVMVLLGGEWKTYSIHIQYSACVKDPTQ